VAPESDLASALQVVGVLLIPVILLLDSWLPDALDCVGAVVPKSSGETAVTRDNIRNTATTQAPRMLGLGAFCFMLALLMTREALGLHYVGIRYEVVPTAWAVMTVVLWGGSVALFVLSGRLFCKKKDAA
jgi:hypothetical protein